MKPAVWTQTYDVNTIVLGNDKRLGLFGLLNILQDAAWIHAEHLGHGYNDMIGRGTIWALARQKLVMSDWPVWGDKVAIHTWARSIAGALFYRDYEVLVGDRKLGESTTGWLILDAQTHRPKKLDATNKAMVRRTEGVLALEPEKIPLRGDLMPVATFQVRNSDLDLNGHVNNTRYAQWVLDSLPNETLATIRVDEYEVNFLAETQVGEIVSLESGALDPSPASPVRRQYQGKVGDKTVFAARLGLSPNL